MLIDPFVCFVTIRTLGMRLLSLRPEESVPVAVAVYRDLCGGGGPVASDFASDSSFRDLRPSRPYSSKSHRFGCMVIASKTGKALGSIAERLTFTWLKVPGDDSSRLSTTLRTESKHK